MFTRHLQEHNYLIIDGHYSYQGSGLWPEASLKNLSRKTGAEFLLVHLTAPQKRIFERILKDVLKSRCTEASIVINDVLLNKHFYEQYRKVLGRSTTVRGITLWNEYIEETAALLKEFVDDFLAEKWKNTFLVKTEVRK